MTSVFPSISAIARVTLLQALRERILYGLLAFAMGLILLSAVLSGVTLGWPVRIVTDLSWSATSLAGTVMAILLGVGAISGELERRTIYPLLAKPVPRSFYVLGKFSGVVATVYLNVLLMLVGTTAMIAIYSHEGAFQYGLEAYIGSVVLLLLRLGIIAAIAILFSCIASPTVALIATSATTFASHMTGHVRFFLGKSESAVNRVIGDAIYYALPDFQLMEALPKLVHGQSVVGSQELAAAAYGVCYLATVLVIACIAFSRRDLA